MCNRSFEHLNKLGIGATIDYKLEEQISVIQVLVLHDNAPIYSRNYQLFQRGAIVEWLEILGYGRESRQKVVRSRLGFAIQ